MNIFYKSPPISVQFPVVRFTINSQKSTINSQQSTVKNQQSKILEECNRNWYQLLTIDRAASRIKRCSARAIALQVCSAASTLTEIDEIPHRTKDSTISGYSAVASPKIEQGMPAALACWINCSIAFITARSRPLKPPANCSELRWMPNRNWVKSLLPMEIPWTPAFT